MRDGAGKGGRTRPPAMDLHHSLRDAMGLRPGPVADVGQTFAGHP